MIPPKLILTAILAGAVLLAIGALVVAIRQSGADAERVKIQTQNTEARDAADDARSRFDAGCPAGMRFDFATGRCAGNAPHPRQ